MTIKNEKIETLFKYINCNKFIFAIGIYFLFSSILLAITKIDICIPCIWKEIFEVNCFGCGLTSAFVYLLKLNFIDAYKSNSLIYIIIPFGIYYLKLDYRKFKIKNIKQLIFKGKKMNNNINESSLSKIYRYNLSYDCGIISAFRKAENCGNGRLYTSIEKNARNKNLKAKLRATGYNVCQIKSKNISNDSEFVEDESFFVFAEKNKGNLLDDLCELGAYFDQDSVLFIPKGTVENLDSAFLIGTNNCPENRLKMNEKVYFENNNLGKSDNIFIFTMNGNPLIFDDIIIEEPMGWPGNGLGWFGLHHAAKQDWYDSIKENIYSNSSSFIEANAYWLNTNGQIYDVPITHIQSVISNPEEYNLTKDYIKFVFNKFNEPLNFEGYAREEILIKMIKEYDWIRLRKVIRNNLWQANVKSFEPLYMNTLKAWLTIITNRSYASKIDEIMVSYEFDKNNDEPNANNSIKLTIGEFLNTEF